jgi:DNA-binding transcriptional MerR regulator
MAELLAFTTEHVCRLTGLSARQVRYWDDTGFFSPTLVHGVRRSFSRIYSFRDVVGLRTIAVLRKRVPLQELRRVGEWLRSHYETPWASLRFGLAGKRIVFFDPLSGVAVEARDGEQTHADIALEPIANEMQRAAEKLRERKADDHGHIVRHRNVVHNAFTLAGTRVPTEAVWSFHKAGYKTAAIIAEFPRLTAKDVKAAIAFEAKRKAA